MVSFYHWEGKKEGGMGGRKERRMEGKKQGSNEGRKEAKERRTEVSK